MMVTLVSQCDKKALKRTRQVLDAYANRIGDKTWQTAITRDGLRALRKQLRRTASKSTAVSCHWIRSRSRSELIWIVGNQSRFNAQGVVPVNTTRKNLLHGEWENTWHKATCVQIVAVIAALLHDVGKATKGFQTKLLCGGSVKFGDPYRHEWISLRVFEAMIHGCEDDQQWLSRLGDFSSFMVASPDWLDQLINDSISAKPQYFGDLPPLAQLVSWLIVSHHRLPFYHPLSEYRKQGFREKERNSFELEYSMDDFYQQLRPVSGWVKNDNSELVGLLPDDFWCFDELPMNSKVWQRAMTRWTNKALNHPPLMDLAKDSVSDPFVMHLARMSLMVGDHNYSSLSASDDRRVKGDKALETSLIANTQRDHRSSDPKSKPKQALDEHLLGVGHFTARFARLLPSFPRELPGIMKNSAFTKRASGVRFQWQNRAYEKARSLRHEAQDRGFFGVNMASTGCGKTLGNARIMYALANQKYGARFTVALGLRVLTLQTGKSFQERLGLDDESLAILVGGKATQRLFELNQSNNEGKGAQAARDSNEILGSESLDDMVDGVVYVEEGDIYAGDLGTVVADKKARDLLYAPVVTCTIDHIISATECLRGGKYIAPMLRLLSSDLVLDEPDDFGEGDLPALCRLVHFAGMFGSKVLLSSATLTPDLVVGLFKAYEAGRAIWNHHNELPKRSVVCAWFDESSQSDALCQSGEDFLKAHTVFVEKTSEATG